MPGSESEIIFERKIYRKLLQWKEENNNHKALLIEGARRVGKTFLVKRFAKEYREFIYIDFSRAKKEVKDYFEEDMEDLESFFRNLSVYYGKTLYEGDTLIIFDEIQKFPRARECLSYLVEDGRYDYIETGSLLSIYRNKIDSSGSDNADDINIPFEEESLKMYPLDFEEFCWAIGESEMTEKIRSCFKNPGTLDDETHARATYIFREYMLVGGMPQPVKMFLLNGMDVNDLKAVDDEKQYILRLYRKDLNEVPMPDKRRVLDIYKDVSGRLSRHEQKVFYS